MAEGPAGGCIARRANCIVGVARGGGTPALHGWPSGRQLFDWLWAMADCEPVAATATVDFRLPQAATPRLRLLFLGCNMFFGPYYVIRVFYFRAARIEPGMFR